MEQHLVGHLYMVTRAGSGDARKVVERRPQVGNGQSAADRQEVLFALLPAERCADGKQQKEEYRQPFHAFAVSRSSGA